jgi:hypothetical protein
MTTFARRVVEELHAFADIPVTDQGVDRAREEFHARLAERSERRSRSRWVLATAAAVVAVAVGVGWWLTDHSSWPVPPAGQPAAPLRQGFIGLPPEGATPSTPISGELLLSYYSHPDRTGTWHGYVYVFADGRVITAVDRDIPQGAHPRFTGWLERRLTPEGVELLLSEVEPLLSEPVAVRLFQLPAAGVDDSHVARLLLDLSWLPASAWEDQQFRAYVPSAFAVCYGSGSTADQPDDPSPLLTALPDEAEVLLRTKLRPEAEASHPVMVRLPQAWGRDMPPNWRGYCSVLTTAEARVLNETLDRSGFEEETPGWAITYPLEVADPARTDATIQFEPVLPHGGWACSGCG